MATQGWSFDDVLPFFKKSERQTRGESELHGAGGSLGVSDPGVKDELGEAMIAAAQACGIPYTDDFNGPSQEGVGYYQLTTWRGRRCSAAKAFLEPAKKRRNLKIEIHALAARVLMDGKQASGVEYFVNGQRRKRDGDEGSVALRRCD